ncbi:MAG: HAD family hydrolase [Clostridia bacterium]|nr:HAD family hydrolase [Clostridia bacterium]
MKYPKMIMFDYGHTLLWEPVWDAERGNRELLKYMTKNPGGYTFEEIRKRAKVIFDEHIMSVRELGLDISGRVGDRILYEMLGIEFSLTPLEMETVFWGGASYGATMPGAAEMLDYINSKGIRSAVISNLMWSGEALKIRLDRLLPNNRFEFVMTSSDYLFRKPNKYLFDIAIRKSGLSPDEIWYCGDDPISDVEGSYAAGLFPVWYENGTDDREGLEKKAPPLVDHLHITEWQELTDLLDGLT